MTTHKANPTHTADEYGTPYCNDCRLVDPTIELVETGPEYDSTNPEHQVLRGLASWLSVGNDLPAGVLPTPEWGWTTKGEKR